MGFFVGVVDELGRMEDRKERNDMFMLDLLEKRKATVIPLLLERIEKNKAERKEISNRLSKAVSFGITKEAAAVLESSGSLARVLAPLEKVQESDDPDKKINKAGIQRLSEAVLQNLSVDKIASAMEYAFDLGFAEDPSSDKLVEAIYANTQEDFEEAIAPLMDSATISGLTAPSIRSFDVNKRALIDFDPADVKAAREIIEKNLMTQLETTTNPTTGQLQFTNPDASGEILNNAVDFYVEEMSHPLRSRSSPEVIKDIFNRVDTLTEDPQLSLRQIAENFKTFEIPPAFQGPMPKSPDTAEEAIKSYTGSSIQDVIEQGYIK